MSRQLAPLLLLLLLLCWLCLAASEAAIGEATPERAFEELTAAPPARRQAAAEALEKRVGAAALPALLEGAASEDPRHRATAAWLLRREDLVGAALPDLLERLGNGSPEERARAAEVLGNARAHRAAASLGAVATDAGLPAALRATAARALGSLDTRHALPPLLAALRDEAPEVRRAAADALGAQIVLGRPPEATPVLQLLGDPDAQVRRAALRLAARHGSTQVTSGVGPRLADPDPLVRRDAVVAAVSLRAPALAQALPALLADGNPQVRDAAAWAARELEAR